MKAPDDLLYEYAVVRYVPRIDREEFINIGLLMLCKRRKWLQGRIFLDQKRLEAFDPRLNFEALYEQAAIFEIKGLPFPYLPVEEKFRWLTAVKSAMLQTSPSHPGIIIPQKNEKPDSSPLQTEFDRLFDCLVKTP